VLKIGNTQKNSSSKILVKHICYLVSN